MLAVTKNAWKVAQTLACVGVVLGVSLLAACSDSDSAKACDSSKCAPGNTCLALNGEVKCRKTCGSNADPATSCPFNYSCVDPLNGDPAFCVQSSVVLEKKPSGQWGAPCQANLGLSNPACDVDQGFLCYGESPTDGAAYCTRYDCAQDSDCGAGFWCGKINVTPNVESAKRKSVGEVQNVCLRRTYCSTCSADVDCPPIAGKNQHCIADGSGQNFCAPECDSNEGCPTEARCAGFDGVDYKLCYPRSTVCVGDGALCAPCRVDTDCGEDGVCVKGQYTTEKSCAKKSATSCGTKDEPTLGSCPKELTDGSKAQVRCLGKVFEQVPEDYCHGIYFIGKEGGDIGCWTPKR